MKIAELIKDHCAKTPNTPYFSFEFFPPKTSAGVENLYGRMERMTSMTPIFIDITWGAGGITEDLSLQIADYAKKLLSVEVLLHVTCTNMTKSDLKRVLEKAKAMGIRNILAVRGDPPKGALRWEPTPGGCSNALELVEFIKAEYQDWFGIAVAGFPEGHPDNPQHLSFSDYIQHLKRKVDAGADFMLTQFFYDVDVFIDFVRQCREAGITCPILPGIMPIHTYSSFLKMTKFCRTKVPDSVWVDLAPIKEDDAAVKQYGSFPVPFCCLGVLLIRDAGVRLCVNMIQKIQQSAEKMFGIHFYTLNLENSVSNILKEVLGNMNARRYGLAKSAEFVDCCSELFRGVVRAATSKA